MITLGKKLFGDHHVVEVLSRQETGDGARQGTWNLAVLVRDNPIMPFVVCEFMEGDQEWLQGHYHLTLVNAIHELLDRATLKDYAKEEEHTD